MSYENHGGVVFELRHVPMAQAGKHPLVALFYTFKASEKKQGKRFTWRYSQSTDRPHVAIIIDGIEAPDLKCYTVDQLSTRVSRIVQG